MSKTFESLIKEDLNITKITWKNSIDSWDIKVNQRLDHDMLARLQKRTSLPLKILRDKIYKGISYTIKKAGAGFFKDPVVTVGVDFKESNFKLILNVFVDRKSITVVTVLEDQMKFHNLIRWELKEFKEHIFDIDCKLDECFTEDGFLFEPSPDKKAIEVFNLYEVFNFEIED